MRTSDSHPLMIDSFDLARGKVGMTLCPGRRGPSSLGEEWRRDLAADVLRLKLWKTDIIVSLTETAEMERLGVDGMGEALREAGILWLHLPIPDTQAPGRGWHDDWRRIAPVLHQRLEAGGRVVIHCKAGLERTAVVAALLQCERGESLASALKVIAKARSGARPLPHQRGWLEALLVEGDRRRQMIRASLFGGAIGDALGAEIEFWGLDRIRVRFPKGVDRILAHDGVPAAITDDTQMTLFTAEGLIRAVVRAHSKGICHPPSVVHHALIRWLLTQSETGLIEGIERKGLVCDPRLHRRRAPGNTCLSALRKSRHFGDMARNDSKGCGTIMRVAPVGLLGTAEQIDTLAEQCSHLTHGHQTGRDAARAFAHVLALVLDGNRLDEALRRVQQMSFDAPTLRAIASAITAPADGLPATVERLGGGWVAEEALSIALYAARVATDFEHGLRIAVTHSGDSDSTGAIAGNLLGLIFPDQVMSHAWRRQVECADLIDRIAADLHTAKEPDRDFAEAMWPWYPGV
ncbi:ADP-ribosylglycohydrolase family protein [Gemmobacter aquaticus]|uniref:ADP-ribosylglycohydrolase family protein n=1 Tax=Gemmobacter aquaticus TaxID=490185 RepID=UPI0011B35F01|nr:ADP-ribosylglycohydrolase family protein [Gemmobacter aquaticus]